MRERPILFSGPMVRSILDGTKTQTRRIVDMRDVQYIGPKGYEEDPNLWGWADQYGDWYVIGQDYPHPGQLCDGDTRSIVCPYGSPGDRLWVKETFASERQEQAGTGAVRWVFVDGWEFRTGAVYRADGVREYVGKWKPSTHMPRCLSRIDLEVTRVRVERLQDISEADARDEGIKAAGDGYEAGGLGWTAPSAREAFRALWDSINGKRAPWASNLWVWVVEFKRVQ